MIISKYKTSIVVSSFYGFSDCWEPFLRGFEKYWSNCEYEIFLIDERTALGIYNKQYQLLELCLQLLGMRLDCQELQTKFCALNIRNVKFKIALVTILIYELAMIVFKLDGVSIFKLILTALIWMSFGIAIVNFLEKYCIQKIITIFLKL